MLSYQAIEAPHEGQADRGRTTDAPAGIRWMATFAKLPAASPHTKATVAKYQTAGPSRIIDGPGRRGSSIAASYRSTSRKRSLVTERSAPGKLSKKQFDVGPSRVKPAVPFSLSMVLANSVPMTA